jgi:hypothetical protein
VTPLGELAIALGVGSGWGAKALARALPPSSGSGPLRVAALSEAIARAIEAAGHHALRAAPRDGRLALDDGAADALCVSGLPEDPAALRECARVVHDGGRVLVATPAGLARRGPARQLVAALLLHAGLADLEQRVARGIVITSGSVRR